MELQNGVVGAGRMLAALVEELARAGTLDTVRRLCVAGARRRRARRALHRGVAGRRRGLHATTARSSRSRRGSVASRVTARPTSGRRAPSVIAGLEDPRDIVVSRLHGMTPFTSTSLDQILRNLGIRTVIATGVSVNLGVMGHGDCRHWTSATRS